MNNWKEIFKVIPLPTLVLKPEAEGDFTILDANEAYLELTGTKAEHLLGKKSNEAFPENPMAEDSGSDKLQNVLEEVVKSGKKKHINAFRYDIPVRGTEHFLERYWNSTNIPLLNNAGVVDMILHSIQDVTSEIRVQKKEKKIEEEIAITRQQYQNFVRQNPDGLFRLDLDGKFLHANKGLARLAELPLEKILEMDFLPFCAPHDREKILDHFQKAKTGRMISFEADFLSASDKPLHLKVLLMPMFLNGQTTEVHGIAKDISGLRESEKIIVEKSRFLEVNAAFISKLLENELHDEALYETFEVIGKTVHADRMYYFGADKNPETGEILISQKVEWCSEKTIPQVANPDMQNMPINQVEEITAPLSKNLPFMATFSEMTDGPMKDIFIEQEIKSMLLLPIFVEDQLYGFVGFDDCTSERTWKQEEIVFLQSLTHNLTSAFEKRVALDMVKKREVEIQQSERKFKALVQEGSDLIAILDTEANAKFVSETSISFLGIAPGSLLGKCLLDFIHPEDRERVQSDFAELIHKKQKKSVPYRIQHIDGSYKWIQTVGTNLIHDPAVKGIVINSRDITTVIEQAREIAQINERYQLAARATQDLMYDWDLVNNEVKRFHRGLEEHFGYNEEEVNNKDFWRKHIHPEDLDQEKEKLAKALADPENSAIKTEYRFRRADGTFAKVIDRGHIIRDHSGRAIRLIGATSDVSDITAKKEALKIANKRFQMAMKATNEMIWDWDIATDSVTRSKGYKSIFGYDTNEATSVHSFWLTKVSPEDQIKIRASLNRALTTPNQEKWELEYRMIKADGTVAHVSDRGYIIRDNNGKATRMVGAVLDVTHSRRLITKIKKQNAVLKEIAWEQSHLVRAPLARIKGLLYILEHNSYEEMTREQVLYHMNCSTDELDGIIRKIVGKTEEMDATL